MRFSIFQDTAIGARSVNQDRMGYCFTRESLLMVVADGMGGHARGEVAAQLTLQACGAAFQRDAKPRIDDPVAFLDAALRASHRELLRYQTVHRLPEAPRTTVVACLVQNGMAWWAHAGDSRLYWLRGGQVVSRTRDHSKVQSLVSLGLIGEHEQSTHPERNKVLNCLGSPYEPTVELTTRVKLRRGDALVLCSDGLWSGVSDQGLAGAFNGGQVAVVVPELIKRAIAHNGRTADNTTVVALEWEGGVDEDVPVLSSLEMPEGAVTTTISYEHIDDDEASMTLTDEDIERQIAEIQLAIQRSSDPSSGNTSR